MLAWSNGAVKNAWLQVTVLPNAITGLAARTCSTSATSSARRRRARRAVSAGDLAAVKRELDATAGVTSRADFNRDGRVNALDLAAAKANLFQSLSPITAPATAMLATPFNGRRYSITALHDPHHPARFHPDRLALCH